MTFTATRAIRFGDEDHAGIVYFPRFFDFYHCAMEDFFAANGRPYREVLDVDRVGWPAVHIESDFESPVRFGDVMEIDVWLVRVGDRSATFAYRGRRQGTETTIATARITVACIDMDTFRARRIPDRYRAMLEAHLRPDDAPR